MVSEREPIERALRTVLKGREFDLEPYDKGSSSLFLLLTTNHHKVGFAALNGNPDLNFAEAFEEFRLLYSEHAGTWADFDLTLIMCKEEKKELSDEFCSKIEVDAYFCRKFVIELGDNLEYEFKRLPFVPVLLEVEQEVKAPISAQSLLTQHGVNSELARGLVVPNAMGVGTIIRKCLSGNFGKLDWLTDDIEDLTTPQQRKGIPIRLDQLRINNFRAYRQKNTIDLDADIVVFFGPNGFGKTSLFDAIDFACTGGVSKLDERYGRNTNRLQDVFTHLDSIKEEAYVGVTISAGGVKSNLERFVHNRTTADVNGEKLNRTKTLMLLAGLEEKPADARIENLVRLFRSSHLFGQEYQSLTSSFKDKSILDENIVARMLALQDYVESMHKNQRVLDEFRKLLNNKEREIVILKESMEVRKSEVTQLRKSSADVQDPNTFITLSSNIQGKVLQETGHETALPTTSGKETVQIWKALVSDLIASTTQKLQLVGELEGGLSNLTHSRNLYSQANIRFDEIQEILNKLYIDIPANKSLLQKSSETVDTLLIEEKAFSIIQDNLTWLLETKPEYDKVKENILKETEKQNYSQSQLTEVIPEVERLNAEDEVFKKNLGESRESSNRLQLQLDGIQQLKADLGDWAQILIQRDDLTSSLQAVEAEITQTASEVEKKKQELSVVTTSVEQLESQQLLLESSRSELKVLLDRIEEHILNEICPVCGIKHESKYELISRLEKQRGIQPQEIAINWGLIHDARANKELLERELLELESVYTRLLTNRDSTNEHLDSVNGKILGYRDRSTSFGISPDVGEAKNVIETVEQATTEKLNIEKSKLADIQMAMDKLQEERATLGSQQESLVQNRQVAESTLQQLYSTLDQINTEASSRQISLEVDISITRQELAATINKLKQHRPQIEAAQTERQKYENTISILAIQKENLESERLEVQQRAVDAGAYIDRIEIIFKQLDVDSNIDKQQLISLKQRYQDKSLSINNLMDDILRFDIALDRSEMSSILSRELTQIDNIARDIEGLEQERSECDKWHKYFATIQENLESQQDRALREYTNKYGPLTSSIQRRLRSVYGFGDIRLQPEKGGIAIRVERKERRDLSPNDYFSESQIQIAMLCLFLSATLTQSWSSFAPILLDDPVKHFDDLNSYALVDLIRGLVTDANQYRQFLISTCDEKLFRLMRQRFSNIPARTLFYEFVSIGEEGPSIQRLPTT